MPITDEATTGDNGIIAQLVANGGRAAAKAPVPYEVADLTSTRNTSTYRFRKDFATITPWRFGRTARYALITLVVVAAVSITVIARLNTGAGRRAASSLLPAPGSLGTSVLLTPGASPTGEGLGASGIQVQLTNPVTGAVSTITPFEPDTYVSLPWVQIGGSAVQVTGLSSVLGQPQVGHAEAFSAERPSRHILGRASYVVPGLSGDEAWLVVNPNWNDEGARPKCSVEEVTLAGKAMSGVDPIPCDLRVVGATRGGLIVTTKHATTTAPDGSSLRLWQPSTDRLVTTYATGGINVQGVNGDFVLYENCATGCPEFVTNLLTGQTRAMPKAPDGLIADDYSLDPYGDYAMVLAVTPATWRSLNSSAISGPGCTNCLARPISAYLLLYNLTTGTLVERRAISTESIANMQWTSDSAFLVVTKDMAEVEAVPLWSDSASIRLIKMSPYAPVGDLDLALPAESFLVLPRLAAS